MGVTTHPSPSATRNAALEEAADRLEMYSMAMEDFPAEPTSTSRARLSSVQHCIEAIRALKTKLTPADTAGVRTRENLIAFLIQRKLRTLDDVEELADALLSQPLAQSGWRTDMENAPRDARSIVADHFDHVRIGKLKATHQGWKWFLDNEDLSVLMIPQPIAWQPLPSPPTVPPKE